MEWVAVDLAFVRNPFCAAALDKTTTSCQGARRDHVSGGALKFALERFSRDDAPPRKRGRIPRPAVPSACPINDCEKQQVSSVSVATAVERSLRMQ